MCPDPDQHLTWRSGLLEACRDVHGVSGHERVAGGWITCDDLARVHADPRSKGDALVSLELFVQPTQGFAHLGGRADRTKGVVFMHTRDPEHRHRRHRR